MSLWYRQSTEDFIIDRIFIPQTPKYILLIFSSPTSESSSILFYLSPFLYMCYTSRRCGWGSQVSQILTRRKRRSRICRWSLQIWLSIRTIDGNWTVQILLLHGTPRFVAYDWYLWHWVGDKWSPECWEVEDGVEMKEAASQLACAHSLPLQIIRTRDSFRKERLLQFQSRCEEKKSNIHVFKSG